MKFAVKESKKPKTKASYDDDEDDEEEDMPRRRSREDVRPPKLKRRAKSRQDDDEDDDDDDERAPVGAGGWKAADKMKEESSTFANDFKFKDDNGKLKDPQVIRFLSSEPIETFREHWVEREGKKSFVCFESASKNGTGKDCPLCELNNSARRKATFLVAVLEEGEDPVIKRITAGPMLTDQFKSYHENKKSGPLDKMYYALSMTGKKSSTAYPMLPIKGRDLAEDYDIEPLTSDELKELRRKAKELPGMYRPTYKELLKVAKGSVGEDDDDDDD